MLRAFVEIQGYRAGLVLNAAGAIVGSTGDLAAASEVAQLVSRFTAGTPREVVDLVLTSSGSFVVFVSPVAEQGAGGFVVVISDPRTLIFSDLLPPPAPSLTGETLLLGLDAGRPVYLSPLRDPAVPLSTHAFATAAGWAAVDGVLRQARSTDYRGKPVLTASSGVEGTPWTVAMKIDSAEAERFIAASGLGGIGIVALAGAVQIALVLALLRRRKVLHAREQREAAERLRFLNALYVTISETDELMVREKDRQRLLDETCRIIVERAGFRMAWIGQARPDGRVLPVAQAGEVAGYLDAIDIRFDLSPAGLGPAGSAMRERRTVVVHDIAAAPEMAPWRAGALLRGYRAVAGVPLLAGERVLGVLVVYAKDPRLLMGEAVPLVEKLAGSLAYSLNVVELEERHLETTRALSASEDQLRQAHKMEAVGRLAGGIAHDFNNLLMVISGYADVALSAKTDEERRRRSIQEILMASERAADLTRQLVAFSRKQVMQPKVLDLNGVVGRAESMLRRLMPDDISIVVNAEPNLRRVRADPSQLEQVLLNLIVNARDAMPKGGCIVVETANLALERPFAVAAAELPAGEYVVMSVSDSGEGMPSDVLDHLFEPFFTTKETGKGAGLGLSMVYGIVRQSGGGVAVESAAGHGSTFRIYFPALPPSVTESEAPQPVPPSNRGSERVMVVEDNDAVRTFIADALRDAGYQVTASETPGPALAALASWGAPFDLLLTDLVLPEMDGYELARRASAARRSLRVLYMTGYSDNPKLRQDALSTGVDLLEKPFSAATLAAKVREILDRPGGVRPAIAPP